MAYYKFTLNVVIRVILIVANCFFLATEYIIREYYITIINLAILLCLQTIFLIKYVRKKNLQVVEYFELIKNKESGFRLKDINSKDSFSQLRKQFNDTNQIIQDIRIDHEVQANYLNHLVNYVKIGLLSFDENDKIQFINPEAKRILGIKNVFKLGDLNILNKSFASILKKINLNESKIIEISGPLVNQKLSVTCGLFKLKDKKIKLVSFQDIDKHLYQNELESWNKLIRILNHEIMNSVTPITSLSKTIKKYFIEDESVKLPENIEPKYINKTVEGLDIIEERGVGLINFVNNYRKISSVPQANKTEINIKKLLSQTRELFAHEIETKNIEIIINSEDLILNADKEQITQILINLIKNSKDAIQNTSNKTIILSALKNEDKINIMVQDFGSGISKEIISNIFIPFYTTKETGSGIGLSLSKQIMKMHDGTILVSSEPNESTVFTLVFNGQF